MRPQVPLLDRAATIGFADVRRFPKAQQASLQPPDMPELPEVETTRRGIAPELEGQRCDGARIRQPRLRHPIPADLDPLLDGQPLLGVERRAKYLLLRFPTGRLLIHLGMSGSLRIVPGDEPPGKHDHVDLLFGGRALRLRDPRRFGLVLWQAGDGEHPLLTHLGVEPLDDAFDGTWLHQASRGRATPVKLFLMDATRVVGIGNIYASESLFRAGIDPTSPVGELGPRRCARLAQCIRETLLDALAAGGSSLRDFVGSNGSPGYFQQQYFVYGRDGEACRQCTTTIRKRIMGQRATFYCPRCQR